MMKKYAILLCSFLVASGSFAQQGYTLRIKLSHVKNYQPRLSYVSNGKLSIDSTYTTEKGWLIMKGTVNTATMASFTVKGNPALEVVTEKQTLTAPALRFFLTNDVITIKGDADKVYAAEVQGGEANADWTDLRIKGSKMDQESWMATRKIADSCKSCENKVLMSSINKTNSARGKAMQELEKSFFDSHPNSPYSMYMLYRMQAIMELDSLKATYNRMGSAAKKNAYAKVISERIASLEATAVGQPAIPLHKKDMNGQEVSLATLKGKYVLLDFWGSWCHPCRASHPHLKEVYGKYKPMGLEIVGIASENSHDLEKNRKIWLEAIKTDDINWVNVLNNEGIESFDAVSAYGISAFPTKILLDKEGKIIGRWIGGEAKELDVKLAEVFGK
ncbi:TlpA disulfide reductase family protein [Chitinophaga arvensicola]|uniref:Thiol-disulfide isomerase or thioredoxin n=1 Tax=Chitinophaga arvensicola TaxID=29529 RepID=A0A1I0S4T0_9BACT|nr:TlpA disulfide reductase family protein [Chitinophaga arvensicola]SEW49814.1 Thiol-disulfide isomerase or thioredoxin [Chitinophaga arvensicola]